MPFTNIDLVRKHLTETSSVRDSYRDIPVELTGNSATSLVHSQLKDGSVTVKGKEIGAPQATIVTLESLPVFVGAQSLIPDSVVVASDSSLGRVYTEHVDYHVDYAGGTVERVESGAIPSGATVAVWFYAYKLYRKDADFAVDHSRGTIRRLSGSDIEDGQTVFIDYEANSPMLDEEQINNAINEADDLLLNLIDPGYRDSSDQSLITAETYLATAVLCRVKALAVLQQSSGATLASHWQELGRGYEADGLKIAARFAAQRGRLSSPTHVTGGDAR